MERTAQRRGWPRYPVVRPAKVYVKRGGWYVPAQTLDAGDGGLLLAVRGRSLPLGTEVEVAVDWNGRGLLSRSCCQPATVVRQDGGYGDQAILAIAYQHARRVTDAAA